MAYRCASPNDYNGKPWGTGQCVDLIKIAAKAPQTSSWCKGPAVKGNVALASGTAIATFQDGKYQNRTNGDSHAAIYVRQDSIGIYVWDQWKGHPVNTRCIRFKG